MAGILETGLALVQKDLDALPSETKGAFVATVNSKGTYTIGVAARLGDGSWKIAGSVQGKLNKTIPDAYAGITKTW